MKLYRYDYFFLLLIALLGATFYYHPESEMWKSLFYLSIGFYIFVSFFFRAIVLQSRKESSGFIQFADLPKNNFNTDEWMMARGIIVTMNALGTVLDGDKEVGKRYSFMVQVDGDGNNRWRALIKDVVVPASHVHSFGKNTEVFVLYNPAKKLQEIVFANDDWHYEKTK